MVSLLDVPPEELPQIAGRPPRPRPPESGEFTIWQVYSWTTAPTARRYLNAIAREPSLGLAAAFEKAGSKARYHYRSQTLADWRKNYPGFRELEWKLRNEPLTAAHFIAIVTLPAAMGVLQDVVNGKEKGDKKQAARYVLGIANLEARRPKNAAEKGAPRSKNPAGRTSALERFLHGDDDD